MFFVRITVNGQLIFEYAAAHEDQVHAKAVGWLATLQPPRSYSIDITYGWNDQLFKHGLQG